MEHWLEELLVQELLVLELQPGGPTNYLVISGLQLGGPTDYLVILGLQLRG